MLYFSHMNPTRSATTESIAATTDPDNTEFSGALLDELSPFGIFLSQFLYMGSWLFTGNKLPDTLRKFAEQLEGSNAARPVNKETDARL
jgi:hypothetical protein